MLRKSWLWGKILRLRGRICRLRLGLESRKSEKKLQNIRWSQAQLSQQKYLSRRNSLINNCMMYSKRPRLILKKVRSRSKCPRNSISSTIRTPWGPASRAKMNSKAVFIYSNNRRLIVHRRSRLCLAWLIRICSWWAHMSCTRARRNTLVAYWRAVECSFRNISRNRRSRIRPL